MPMPRLLLDSLLAFVLACGFAAVGWTVALPLADATAASAGLASVVVAAPLGLVRYQVKLAAMLATLPVFAWIVALLFRIRARSAPSFKRLGTYLVVPALAMAAGMTLRFLVIHSVVAVSSGITRLMLQELSLARWGFASGLLAAGLLAVSTVASRPASGAVPPES